MANVGSDNFALAGFSGAVVDENGQTLLSTDTTGETSLLHGPSALREILAGVANGDFASLPPDPSSNITDENPLPYWTVTAAGTGVTAKSIADASQAWGNAIRVTVAASANGSITLTRYIPVPGSRGRTFSLHPIVTLGSATNCIDAELYMSGVQYTSSLVSISGTTITQNTYQFNSYTAVETVLLPDADQQTTWSNTSIASDAAFYKITIVIQNAGVPAASRTIDIYDVRMLIGSTDVMIADGTNPSTYGPGWISADDGVLALQAYVASNQIYKLQISSEKLGIPGPIYWRGLTGPSLQLGGTNGRAWVFSSSDGAADVITTNSSTRAGILVTKSCTGQPTTNLNGTGATDAFADVLRNGGLALDVSNNRGYWYSSGWKYTALTTPSDSRLKQEITEIGGALDKLRQLIPVAFKWKAPEAHGRTECVSDDGTRMGFIADQVATTDLAHWVETLGVDEREAHLVDTDEVLAVNIPQNEMEALLVQALLDIDARLAALESR